MGYRLSKVYTRTGDNGTTGLGNGERVDKDHPRVEAYGTVDELNSFIGAILALPLPEHVQSCLTAVQHDLFDLGGELCIPDHILISAEHNIRLEQWIDRINTELPPLKEFILPAGGQAASGSHIARAVCRRAERRLTTLARDENINDQALIYLNRLSDLLFVIARSLSRLDLGGETLWQPGARQ